MRSEYFLEKQFNDYVNSEDFQYYIQNKIQESDYYKYSTIAPEGFIMIPEKVLNDLKDFDNWKEFKNNPNYIKEKSIEIFKTCSHFNGEH